MQVKCFWWSSAVPNNPFAGSDWAKKELVTSGMVVEVSLHHDKAGKNPHAHLLCTLRRIDGAKFSAKKSITDH
jgi:hypothetical protein